MTEDQVAKYYEVRLRSLAIMAVMIVILCIFLFFFFVWRGQYLYAALMAGVAVIVALAGARLTRYAGLFRKAMKAPSFVCACSEENVLHAKLIAQWNEQHF